MNDNFADVQQSFNRCLMRRDFLRRFYDLFTQRDRRIAARFDGTDWDTQVRLLRNGISAALMHAGGSDLGRSEITRLAASHSRKGHDIPAWMYDDWLEALIQALRETDQKMDEQLEARWRAALEPVIRRMINAR